MNLKYPYLDIAIEYLGEDGRLRELLYNSAPTIKLPPAAELSAHFANLEEGYLMWNTGRRRAFSYFMLDDDGGNHRITVTLRMDFDVLAEGRRLMNVISAIKNRVKDGELLSEDAIDTILDDAGLPQEPLRCSSSGRGDLEGKGVCYRTYMSGSDLAAIFSFPRQKEYTPYKGVLVIPATVSQLPGSALAHVTAPVDKALMVVCPKGVTASLPCVELADKLTLTYSLDGFEPVSETIEVGMTNRYVRMSGPALVANDANHAGIVFRRKVPYSVKSATGEDIETYTVLVNGRTATRDSGGFEVSSLDFMQGPVKLTVASTNYRSYECELTCDDIIAGTPVEAVLERETSRVVLRLDFGAGRMIESPLSIEKNTGEYNELRSGSFHGFRAHRLAGIEPETFNVDLRGGSLSAVASQGGSDSVSAGSGDSDDYGCTPVAAVSEESDAAEVGCEDSVPPRRRNVAAMVAAMVAVAIAVVAVAGGIVWYLLSAAGNREEMRGEDVTGIAAVPEEDSDSVATPVSAAGSDSVRQVIPVEQPQPVVEETVSADEKSDVEYLNRSRVWKRSALKSEKYRSLYDAMLKGDIDAVVSHEYYYIPGRATNGTAVKIADMLWAAKGSGTERSNVRVLTSLADKESINLWTVYEDLSRLRDGSPNTNPRPVKK